MIHSLANLEHHHFKYEDHRRPGDAHIHFLGATAFSFAAGFTMEDGDEMVIEFDGFGRVLRTNTLMPNNKWSVSENRYDGVGRKKEAVVPVEKVTPPTSAITGNVTAFEYDAFDRPTSVTAPFSQTST